MKNLKYFKKIKASKNDLHFLPKESGVYLFLKNNYPIYIGKAINLRSRVSFYFSNSSFGKSKQISESASDVGYIPTTGEFESLILESELIKKYKPHYNVSLKDDKSPIYIRITNDKYPRVLTSRKSELRRNDRAQFGPYPSATYVYEILTLLKKIFPYATHLPSKIPCFDNQIGLCVMCPSIIENTINKDLQLEIKKEYSKNISRIKNTLSGKFKSVRLTLEKNMKIFSKNEEYEKAHEIKRMLDGLEYLTKIRVPASEFLNDPNFKDDVYKKEIAETNKILHKYFPGINCVKIECYDVAHISGTSTTASMVTFVNADPYKALYRHFRIRTSKKSDDISSLQQVAKRRVNHFDDWGYPDLIIVDGGKGQVKVFYELFNAHGLAVVGLAKRFEKLVVPMKRDGKLQYDEFTLKPPAKFLFQRIRDEAHRFARRYHKKLIKKSLFE